MSAHHILGVLEDDEHRLWATLDRAIALADAERARLTLAKTTDPGWMMRWFGSAGLNAMCVSSDLLDLRTSASHKLARAAEFVPACVPVTTLLLSESTPSALMELVRRGHHDIVVVTDALLGRRRRLRRELEREDVRIVLVPGRPAPAADTLAGDADGQPAKARA